VSEGSRSMTGHKNALTVLGDERQMLAQGEMSDRTTRTRPMVQWEVVHRGCDAD
jgi:hypothetical protein